jgi:hypothetical protein
MTPQFDAARCAASGERRRTSTVPRVPDAVQRSSRCSAAPGPIQTPSTMGPEPAAHHAGIAVKDARKRAGGRQRRAQTRWRRCTASGERSARALCTNAIDGCRGVYLSRALSRDAVAGPARGLPNFALKSAKADPGDSISLSKAYFRSDRCVSRFLLCLCLYWLLPQKLHRPA